MFGKKSPPPPCLPCNARGVPIQVNQNINALAEDEQKKITCRGDAEGGGILKIKHKLRSRPMNLNILALPNKRHALNSWKQTNKYLHPEMLEQLRGIVEGQYMGINVTKCADAMADLRKRRQASKVASAEAERIKCSCKNGCTFVSLLLQKLRNVNIAEESKSLTCIIFNELCSMSGVEKPEEMEDEKKHIILLLAKKFGGWIDSMLAKKNKFVCNDLTLDPQAKQLLDKIVECPCAEERKAADEAEKAAKVAGEAESKKQAKGAGGKKGKGKKKK